MSTDIRDFEWAIVDEDNEIVAVFVDKVIAERVSTFLGKDHSVTECYKNYESSANFSTD